MTRLEKIISLVSQEKRIEVASLSERLGVSKVTIRKDLDKLESKGLLHREHGFAVLNSGDDLNVRLSFNYNLKGQIARAAAQLVNDNDTIMIESGSTCALLAEIICQTKRHVTIITNSCFIANYVRNYDSCQIILLGGEYKASSQVTVGPLLKTMIENFHVDQAFVGVDGYDPGKGFMGQDLMRSEVASYMAKASENLVVLTDSSKFKEKALVNQLPFSQVARVVTDKGVPAAVKSTFKDLDISITMV